MSWKIVRRTLDAQDDLLGILRVLGEVLVEEGKGVVLGRSVELSAIPQVGAVGEGSPHGGEGLLLGGWVWAPGEACSRLEKKMCDRVTSDAF